MTTLEKIVGNRRKLLDIEKKRIPYNELRTQVDYLLEAGNSPLPFLSGANDKKPFLIAEIKRASPSKGIIRRNFNIDHIAKIYDKSPFVDAISILTEPDFFWGSYEYVEIVSDITNKPILMKDFILDTYQIYRGYLLGASAILLISSIIEDDQIQEFVRVAKELNMNILFETHTADEYRGALDYEIDIIGINNRDLKNFSTDINNTINILEKVGKPEGKMIISESGIDARDDIKQLWQSGVDGFLIGERFMKSDNIEAAITCLLDE
ncbi:MAG: indole-3-glycerol phosphate synthase TrpC [Spirochaetota bacterium]|nr:indole-3-glycerol phosphate synthase TrpC [Spirochaetota bacterium]